MHGREKDGRTGGGAYHPGPRNRPGPAGGPRGPGDRPEGNPPSDGKGHRMSGPERQQSEDRQGRRGPVALQGRAGRYADSGPGLRPWELAENPRSHQREPVLQYRHLGRREARLGPETGRRRRKQHRERERPGVRRLQARRLQRRDRPRTLYRPLHLRRTGGQRVLFRRPAERPEGSP